MDCEASRGSGRDKYIAYALRDQDVDTPPFYWRLPLSFFADLAMIEGSSIRLESFERCIDLKYMRRARTGL
jgi:hypothetical protein